MNNSVTVLLVDSEPESRRVIASVLEDAHINVWEAATADDALRVVDRRGLPHLLIVSPDLSYGISGTEFCRRIKAIADVPVIALVSVTDKNVPVWLLEECAADVLIRPPRPEEVLLRVNRVLRQTPEYTYRFGASITTVGPNLQLNLLHQEVVVNGRSVALSERETALLQLLVRHESKTLTFDYLIAQVWPGEPVGEDTLRVAIHRLRQKIESQPDQPRHILSVRGRGYTFVAS